MANLFIALQVLVGSPYFCYLFNCVPLKLYQFILLFIFFCIPNLAYIVNAVHLLPADLIRPLPDELVRPLSGDLPRPYEAISSVLSLTTKSAL
jgi:hypothetical protein